jgi:hypothetical protein
MPPVNHINWIKSPCGALLSQLAFFCGQTPSESAYLQGIFAFAVESFPVPT